MSTIGSKAFLTNPSELLYSKLVAAHLQKEARERPVSNTSSIEETESVTSEKPLKIDNASNNKAEALQQNHETSYNNAEHIKVSPSNINPLPQKTNRFMASDLLLEEKRHVFSLQHNAPTIDAGFFAPIKEVAGRTIRVPIRAFAPPLQGNNSLNDGGSRRRSLRLSVSALISPKKNFVDSLKEGKNNLESQLVVYKGPLR